MNELEILKEIGLREVARKTHIEPEFLGYIINKEFDKLSRVNAKGYVKILQREYDIDFSGWMSEYDAYLGEHASETSAKTQVTPKIFVYTNEGEPEQKISSGTISLLLWIAVLVALVAAGYYFGVQKYLQNLPSFFSDENRSAVYSDAGVVQEAQSSLPEANITIVTASPKQQEQSPTSSVEVQIAQPTQPEQNLSTPPVLSQPEPIQPAQENLDQTMQSQNLTQLDQNAGTQGSALERLTNGISTPKDANTTRVISGEQATITPKQRVWMGVINLETGKKTSIDSGKPLQIDLKIRQLVVCGNGNVELKVGDEVSKFDGGRSARFLVENGTIKQISYEEFIEINKGKSW